MSDMIITIIITALSSSLATSLGFITVYNSKLMGLQKDISRLVGDIKEVKANIKAIQNGQFSCSFHAETLQIVGRHDERLKNLEKQGNAGG